MLFWFCKRFSKIYGVFVRAAHKVTACLSCCVPHVGHPHTRPWIKIGQTGLARVCFCFGEFCNMVLVKNIGAGGMQYWHAYTNLPKTGFPIAHQRYGSMMDPVPLICHEQDACWVPKNMKRTLGSHTCSSSEVKYKEILAIGSEVKYKEIAQTEHFINIGRCRNHFLMGRLQLWT